MSRDAGAARRRLLAREWVHAHEEDTVSEMVFRPAGYKLPPARGRRSFRLCSDGRLVEAGPGPTDRRQEREGRWELQGADRLVLYPASPPKTARVLQIRVLTGRRLVLKK